MSYMHKCVQKHGDYMYFVFRVLTGVLFLFHGVQKLGWLGGNAQTGFMLFIGIAELLGGLAIALGFLTRLAAIGSAIIMLGAYFTAHTSIDKMLPIQNRGELALLYFAAFLVLIAYGGKKWFFDELVFKKELF